jgi:Membrane proteins related to metalloendopeptidases
MTASSFPIPDSPRAAAGAARRWAAGLLLPGLLLAGPASAFVATGNAPPPAPARCSAHHTTLHHGQSLSSALDHLGVDQTDILRMSRHLKGAFRPRALRPGDAIIACLTDGRPHHMLGLEIRHRARHVVIGSFPRPMSLMPSLRVAFTPPSKAHSDDIRQMSFHIGDSLDNELQQRDLSSTEASSVGAWIKADAGLPQSLPNGTRISVLVGQDAGNDSDRLLRLRIWYHDHLHTLYSYVDSQHRRWLLDRRGMGMLHLPMSVPVDYTRISSGWGWRINPVLHKPEFHRGIDMAAGMGTPVRATAPGVVAFTGWHGNYGRLIIVNHAPGAATRYGHLSRVAQGIHPGSVLHSGQVIGYVGSTGLSTGPHLYYEIWLNGTRIDPLDASVNLPVRLAGRDLRAFQRYVARIRQLGAIEPTSG